MKMGLLINKMIGEHQEVNPISINRLESAILNVTRMLTPRDQKRAELYRKSRVRADRKRSKAVQSEHLSSAISGQ